MVVCNHHVEFNNVIGSKVHSQCILFTWCKWRDYWSCKPCCRNDRTMNKVLKQHGKALTNSVSSACSWTHFHPFLISLPPCSPS